MWALSIKWYHIDCQGVLKQMYKTMGASSLSWCCLNCGIPKPINRIFATFCLNISDSYSSLSSLPSEGTSLSALSDSSFSSSNSRLAPSPLASSSPARSQGKEQQIEQPLGIIAMNWQSQHCSKWWLELSWTSLLEDGLSLNISTLNYFHLISIFLEKTDWSKKGRDICSNK